MERTLYTSGHRYGFYWFSISLVAFIFDVKGLIADMSIKGAKFNKLDLSE